MHRIVTLAAIAALLCPTLASAQHPDSARTLQELRVTLTRSPEELRRLGASVTVLDSAAIRRGRLSTGLDEALAFVPGLVTGNRNNYSVDQRLTIRGFGARANFGVRGIKVLLDGVPQTLPDGQSTLTNLDLGLVDRIEVLRGSASALYGNASGGVVSLWTRVVPATPWQVEGRSEVGSFGTSKAQVVLAGRSGPAAATVAVSRFVTDGFRQHSAAEQRRASLATNWYVDGSTVVTLRLATADDPRAENPGALTTAELGARRDSAAASNILRGADKAARQHQVSLTLHREGRGWQADASTWIVSRSLANPLAAPPPAPVTATSGTWVGIERRVWGARAAATAELGPSRLTAGVDAQSMRDDRQNQRSVSGAPTGQLLLMQRERVTEVGPFLQLLTPLNDRMMVRTGVRHDATRFDVADRYLLDGDASGRRTMQSWSGSVGLTATWSPRWVVWSSVATAFETPTTTELANRAAGDGGFNPELNPQRSVSAEVGVRGADGRLRYELALYGTATEDAIVAWRELGGRSYFRNAGRTRIQGVEFAGQYLLRRGLSLLASWTWTDARFTNYRIQNGAAVDTLDGRRLAGLPPHVVRLGLRGEIGLGATIDVDHFLASSQFGDDHNAIRVAGPGVGVTGVRVAWQHEGPRGSVEPFIAVTNLFARDYVGSVTLNGAGGRVFEPAAGRTVYAGLTVGLRGRE
ncbi:MAG: TonB-dependent receptor [Gemmatimonadota bacterium]